MPRIVKFQRLRFVINNNDHNPPHFHVVLNNNMNKSAKIELETWRVLRKGEFSDRDLTQIIHVAKKFRAELVKAWREHHGEE
jgi:hypothetical protein